MARSPSKSSGNITEVQITSWKDFLRVTSSRKFKNWAFRGQSDANWELWPTLPRELMNRSVLPSLWTEQENRILRIFQRKALHFLPNIPPVGDTPRWLALMQHHGAPTRMLDFTWSPYVAAFFALEHATDDAAVWAINTRQLKTYGFGPYLEQVDRPVNPTEWLKQYGFGSGGVAVGEPYFMNKRLIAQSGTLAIPYDISKSINSTLGARENMVAKFVLSCPKVRDTALEELYTMNINYATLFPDLDGLSRSLAYELEYHWLFDPHTGSPK
jgi:hypothetical protein